MRAVLRGIAFVSILPILLIPGPALSETKTFIREYVYQAGDEDSKNSSRTIALREVKRLLLEELGTYLESESEVKNFQLTRDQITALTAGIVQTELVEERWDGRTYWLKSKITADSGDVIKSIDALRKDRQKTKELEEIRKRSEALLKENERLRKELATATGAAKRKETAAYQKTIQDLSAAEWFEKGYSAGMAGRYAEALAAYGKAVELNPQFALAYQNRGAVYGKIGNHAQAVKEYDRAIELDPRDAGAYHNRGNAYAELGNHNQALSNYTKAIELNPQYGNAYVGRGIVYNRLGNPEQAIREYDRALKLNPKDAVTYALRAGVHDKLNNYHQAIHDFSKAIELNPQDARIYYLRGLTHGSLGNSKQSVADWQIAARLGLKEAQEFLKKRGMAW